jgi:hypothetical protein
MFSDMAVAVDEIDAFCCYSTGYIFWHHSLSHWASGNHQNFLANRQKGPLGEDASG